ncbi:hypothetical protein HY639_06035, partial [Candidatus Woesearchaeota archaeon]|nr:hypothetical protein [Candidatus Woesearchaeota archaeon]
MIKYTIPKGERLTVYEKSGDFDEAYAALQKKGVQLMTAAELAEARIRAGPKHPFSTSGCWVAENYNYLPNGEILIASRDSNPILKQPKQATDAHRSGKEFYLAEAAVKELRERATEDVEKAFTSGVLLVPRKNVKAQFPTHAFADEAVTYFLFRQQAKPYGEFLAAQGIVELPPYV